MKKILIPLLIIIIAIFAVTIFLIKPNKSDKSTNQNTNNTTENTFEINNYGRQITIKSKPKKVLTLGPNCTELFVALGLTDYIVGNSLKNHSRGPLPIYAEEYKKIPELSYGPATREGVISSGADFIYGIDWEFGSSGVDIKELEDYGITVYTNSAENIEQVYNEIRDIGKIFDIEKTAQDFIEDQKIRIEKVQDKIKNKKPVKVLVYDSGNDGIFTCSGTNFESLLIELAGGENIFKDIKDKEWVTVSYEEVIARNPDIILIHDYDSPSIEIKTKEIKSNPVLASLNCVKNNHFAYIELESVLPGGRMAYTVEKLSKYFYPDLFGSANGTTDTM